MSYLEQLFARLRKNGLVESTRGPGGGYRLSRDGGEIAVAEVIAAVDEKVDATRCGGMANCQDDQQCLTHELWMDLSDQIQRFLSSITLKHLVERRGVREVCRRQDHLFRRRYVAQPPAAKDARP